MANVTNTGVTPTTLTQYVGLLETAFRAAFGEGLNVDPETPQGQLIGLLALRFAESDEAVVNVGNATSIFRANGQQIDNLATILRVRRSDAQRSQVTVTITGVPSTLVESGTRASTTSGDLFIFDDDVQIPASGTINATMFSVETGAIAAAAGTLINIVDVVPGWETITNAAAATPGRNQQNDPTYRTDYFDRVGRNALVIVEAIAAVIAEVEGVTDQQVFENDTAAPVTVQNVTLPANSILSIVEGGADLDIAQAIRMSKTIGIPTTGTTTVDAPHPAGFNTPISFTRVGLVPLDINMTIQAGAGFPANGLNLIKERITQYFAGTMPIENQQLFENDGLQIGETLNLFRLYTPINSVPGHNVMALEMAPKDTTDFAQIIQPDLNQRFTIESLDDITITVVP